MLFVKDAWHVVEPSTPFVDGWHLHAIGDHLTAVTNGEIKKLLVNMPPRHCKSTLISTFWPVWSWLSNPSIRWLCSSYALSLAIRDNRKCRLLIQSPWFQERYGYIFQFSGDQNVKGRFENNKRGYRLAVSVGSAATGEGGDILLCDDPHPLKEAVSDLKRENALTWFKETWSTRLNDRNTGAMVTVGQRIHQEDVSGYLISQKDWVHLNLPAEFESARKCSTILGWSDPRKEEGQLLWSERFSKKILLEIEDDIKTLAYATQYQQNPVPAGGYIFKQDNERHFVDAGDAYLLETPGGIKPVLKSDCWLFGTVDLAISSKQSADYTVICIWAVTPARDLLLLHMIRGHWTHPEQQAKIKQLNYQYRPDYFSIENVAYQLAIIQDLLAEGIACREYRPTKDKVSRASSASVWHAAGKMYFLKNAPWLIALQEEMYFFPKAKHDDIVDNESMACDIVRARGPLSDDIYEEIVEEKQPDIIPLTTPLQGEDNNMPVVIPIIQKQVDPFVWIGTHGGWDE
jgi:predicted phage terminase large subunit-like protein